MNEIMRDIRTNKVSSAYSVGPFDEGKEQLERHGYGIISLEENAGLRILSGRESEICRAGNWVREGTINLPDKRIFITKKSPIMANPSDATDCNRRLKDFYLTDEQVEYALEDSVEVSGLVSGKLCIPTNRFSEEEITDYIFGKIAGEYGKFLENCSTYKLLKGDIIMPVWFANSSDRPFARQGWFHRINGKQSDLCFDDRCLHGAYGRTRGIKYGIKQIGEETR